jgi:glycosyltransferase involved in cell wall biosynthesis
MNNKLSLAYLTTAYPAVSHTFIRRELLEIERRGHFVMRLSLRCDSKNLVDPLDIEEEKKTFCCLSQPIWVHFSSFLRTVLFRPVRFLLALRLGISTARLSDRGLLRNLSYLAEACTFLWVLKKNAVEHVHVHFGTNATAVARFIKYLGGPGYSFTVHGPTEFDSAIGFDLPGKIQDARFVIAISDFCSAQLRRWTAPDEWKKIQIVHCTVGDDFFSLHRAIPYNCRRFVCVGRLAAQKGQLVLIDAFYRLISSGRKSELIFAGDGELRPEIEKRIRQLGIEDHVRITGFLSELDVREKILSSRALVMPSFAEGLPMVIMEAFALGRPVISTYVAAIPELVHHGENGWLVPAANPHALYEALIDAYDSPLEKLSAFAADGRGITYSRHRTETEGERLEDLFLHMSR